MNIEVDRPIGRRSEDLENQSPLQTSAEFFFSMFHEFSRPTRVIDSHAMILASKRLVSM